MRGDNVREIETATLTEIAKTAHLIRESVEWQRYLILSAHQLGGEPPAPPKENGKR